jgi:hypothetical protein
MSNDVLVEVKSTYDATGTQAADRAQVNLANTTKEVGRQMEHTEKQTQKARQALGGLSAAAAASQGSFGGFAIALQNLGGGLADVAAKFALVAGAFSAGYGIGSAIDKWLGLSDAISGASEKGEELVSMPWRSSARDGLTRCRESSGSTTKTRGAGNGAGMESGLWTSISTTGCVAKYGR